MDYAKVVIVIVNQQRFLEQNQREKLATTNLVVTGIPKKVILFYQENMLTETNKEVSAIFDHIKVPTDEGLYKIHEFESTEDKPTLAIKLVFEDIENKVQSTK